MKLVKTNSSYTTNCIIFLTNLVLFFTKGNDLKDLNMLMKITFLYYDFYITLLE